LKPPISKVRKCPEAKSLQKPDATALPPAPEILYAERGSRRGEGGVDGGGLVGGRGWCGVDGEYCGVGGNRCKLAGVNSQQRAGAPPRDLFFC
jgi:hypothetical protein